MSGLTEILLVLVVILVVFYLPKMRTGVGDRKAPLVRRIPVRMRLAIVASVFWPVLAAVFLEPWKGNLLLFLYTGIAPVAAGWAVGWVVTGYWRRGK